MKAELIDVMGDDLRVVNAARVSFDKESDWDRTSTVYMDGSSPKNLSAKDRRLLNYLAREGHWTPFSHVMITMRETVPIFVARQRFKHAIGFTYNEVSRRYVDDEPTFYTPKVWRAAPENRKQGSAEEMYNADGDPEEFFCFGDTGYSDIGIQELSVSLYKTMIERGVAPEMARMVLPQSMYTSYYTTGSLAAWARAYKLRSEETAQQEIRNLAHQWGDIIGGIKELEHSWKALVQST